MTAIDFFLNDKWTQTLKGIAGSGQIADTVLPYFDSKLTALNDNEAVVSVPNFINYTIMQQNKEVVENCLEEVLGRRFSVVFIQPDDTPQSLINKNTFQSDFLLQ